MTELDDRGEAKICLGCGSTKSLATIRAAGGLSCCPERAMVPAREIWQLDGIIGRNDHELAREALEAIADGEGDADVIAQQTLEMLDGKRPRA